MSVVRGFLCLGLFMALCGCGGRPPYEGKSVAELERMLREGGTAEQIQGAHGLSLHGREAKPAVPTLAAALRNPETRVRQNAAGRRSTASRR